MLSRPGKAWSDFFKGESQCWVRDFPSDIADFSPLRKYTDPYYSNLAGLNGELRSTSKLSK